MTEIKYKSLTFPSLGGYCHFMLSFFQALCSSLNAMKSFLLPFYCYLCVKQPSISLLILPSPSIYFAGYQVIFPKLYVVDLIFYVVCKHSVILITFYFMEWYHSRCPRGNNSSSSDSVPL